MQYTATRCNHSAPSRPRRPIPKHDETGLTRREQDGARKLLQRGGFLGGYVFDAGHGLNGKRRQVVRKGFATKHHGGQQASGACEQPNHAGYLCARDEERQGDRCKTVGRGDRGHYRPDPETAPAEKRSGAAVIFCDPKRNKFVGTNDRTKL
jgi:hypothetical protein